VRFQRESKQLLLKLVVLCAVLVLCFVFVKVKKAQIKAQSVAFLTGLAGESSNLDFHIGKVGIQWLSHVKFEDIQVHEIGFGPEDRPIFSAKEIWIRYRFLDFLSKTADPKIELVVKDPQVWWRPHVGIRRPQFPSTFL